MSNPIELLSKAQAAVREAEKAYAEQFLAVKKHHNEVYQPMWEEKKRREKVLVDAQTELKAVMAANQDLVDAIKSLKLKTK
jgi:uncharacterized hydantoinase/oxoprolinase family protein